MNNTTLSGLWRFALRPSPFAIFCLLLLPAIAGARIGETREQCDKRYGAPTKVEAGSADSTEAEYVKEGFSIHVLFIDGRAQKISYSHGTAFTDKQITKLLNNNARGETWHATLPTTSGVYGSWESSKGATAEYFTPKPWEPLKAFQYSLEIRSGKLMHLLAEREAEKKRQEEEKAEAEKQRLKAAREKAEAAKQEEERRRLQRLDNL
jgi:signal transduction histidine kinase